MNITAKGLTKIYGSGENRVVALDKADLRIALEGIHFHNGAVGKREEHVAPPAFRAGQAVLGQA